MNTSVSWRAAADKIRVVVPVARPRLAVVVLAPPELRRQKTPIVLARDVAGRRCPFQPALPAHVAAVRPHDGRWWMSGRPLGRISTKNRCADLPNGTRNAPEKEMFVTPDEFLAESPLGRAVFSTVAAILSEHDDVTIKTTKSQIAFKRRRGSRTSGSPACTRGRTRRSCYRSRFAEGLPPAGSRRSLILPAGSGSTHLEVRGVDDLDDEVRDWLGAAYESAG